MLHVSRRKKLRVVGSCLVVAGVVVGAGAITPNLVSAIVAGPVAVADAYTATEDVALSVTAPGVLGNDTDAQADPLTAVLGVPPTSGTLMLDADGSFLYTPSQNFNGIDSFTYSATDGTSSSATATVTITVDSVNDAPIANPDSYTVIEDTPFSTVRFGVLSNDTDADADPRTAALVVGPGHGVLVLTANGHFTYTPDRDFFGTDTFTYRASDGIASSDPATVTLMVEAVNDAPVGVNDVYSTKVGTALLVAAPGPLVNDYDVDGDTIFATNPTTPAHGSLTVFGGNGSFTYVPNAGFVGVDTFEYQADDDQVASEPITVTVTVTANVAPVATGDTYTATEDTTLLVATPGVLGNDTDADADALTAVLVDSTTHGTLTLLADGSFTYVPAANFSGSDSFTYRADDGTDQSAPATVNISVTAVNDAPTAPPATGGTTPQDTPLLVAAPGPMAGATDADGDALTAVLVSGPAHGTLVLNADGSYTYTPAAGFAGTDSFSYAASDGTSQSAPVTITIVVQAAIVTQVPRGELPVTGANIPGFLLLAFGALGVGVAMILVRRRRIA